MRIVQINRENGENGFFPFFGKIILLFKTNYYFFSFPLCHVIKTTFVAVCRVAYKANHSQYIWILNGDAHRESLSKLRYLFGFDFKQTRYRLIHFINNPSDLGHCSFAIVTDV